MAKSVFISSTSKDLAEHRAAVDKAIRRLELRPINMDDFGSQPGGASSVSLREVEKADIFVGIIAWRYGYVPEGMTKSVTEQEYDQAVRLHKPRLMYLVGSAYDWEWPGKTEHVEDETRQARLADFKARIEKNEVRSLFTTPENLASQVTADLSKLLDKQQRQRTIIRFGGLLVALAAVLTLMFVADPGIRSDLIEFAGLASPTPTVTPVPIACANGLQWSLQPGQEGQLTALARLKNSPTGSVIRVIESGSFTVLGGPECDSTGMSWWQVRMANGQEGWIAEGDDSTYWVAATLPPCPPVVEQVVEELVQRCSTLGRNQLCYARRTVTVERDSDEPDFSQPGDIISLDGVRSITLSPFNPATGDWGIAMMKFQPNLPNLLPGQSAFSILVGSLDENNKIIEAYQIQTGPTGISCQALPARVAFQNPDGSRDIEFTINTILLKQG